METTDEAAQEPPSPEAIMRAIDDDTEALPPLPFQPMPAFWSLQPVEHCPTAWG